MKKLLSVFLAICMILSLIPVLASADSDNKAIVTMPVISGAKPNQERIIINKGASDMWWLTTDEGYLTTEGASASNYNVKLSYPREGTPTLYLKSAKIFSPEPGSGQTGAISIGRPTDNPSTNIVNFDFIITVEADSQIKGTWAKYDGTAQQSSHGTGGICAKNIGTLTITGPGKLDIYSDDKNPIWKESEGDLILKDANIKAELVTPQTWGSRFDTIYNEVSNIIFDNTKADLANNIFGCVYARNGDVIIKNGSDLKLFAASDKTSCISLNAGGTYTLENSKLLVESNGASALSKNTFTMVGVNAKGGTKEANAKAFNAKKQDGYTYLIAGPDVVIETEAETTPATTKPASTKATSATKATTGATQPAATKPGATTGNHAATGNNATTPAANNNNSTNTTGQSQNNDQLWLWILLGVVCAASIGTLTFVFIKRFAPVKATAETEETETEEPETNENAE